MLDQIFIVLPGSSLVHWGASLIASSSACFAWILPNIAMRQFLPEISTNANATFPLNSNSTEPVLQFDSYPYAVSNPYLFFLLTHGIMGIGALLIFLLGKCIRYFTGIPKLSTLRRRLKRGQSNYGALIAYVSEQFDNKMISGAVVDKNIFIIIPVLGCITIINVISRYLWLKSFFHAPAPFAQVIDYGFIIYLPALTSICLKEPLHGLKLFSSIFSFIGIYFHFFNTPSMDPIPNTLTDTLTGTIQGLLAALCLALYFILYKYCNPRGWMTLIICWQGLSVAILGCMTFPIIRMFGELFRFPQTSNDWSLISQYALFDFLLYFCMNEALRWGDPSGLSAALALAPTVFVLVEAMFFGTATLNGGKITAFILTFLGFSIDALYQYGQAIKKREKKQKLIAAQFQLDDEVPLMAGSEYII